MQTVYGDVWHITTGGQDSRAMKRSRVRCRLVAWARLSTSRGGALDGWSSLSRPAVIPSVRFFGAASVTAEQPVLSPAVVSNVAMPGAAAVSAVVRLSHHRPNRVRSGSPTATGGQERAS